MPSNDSRAKNQSRVETERQECSMIGSRSGPAMACLSGSLVEVALDVGMHASDHCQSYSHL